jgi:hypothetical protein
MLVAYVILGIVVYGGCIVGLYWEWREIRANQHARTAAGEVEVDELLEPDRSNLSGGRDEAAADGYVTAWCSLNGLSARMILLAVASDQLAQRCRGRALDGAPPLRSVPEADYDAQLPADLRDTAPRPGSVSSWQALDRALKHVSAIHGSDDAGNHADAHEQVSIAARRLGDELAMDGVQTDLEHCIFCQREADEDLRVLYTPRAAICEDCVHTIDRTIEDL